MVVSKIDRSRDAKTSGSPTPRKELSMLNQLTTSLLFGDSRLPTRFWDKVRVTPSGCWEWVAARNSKGYGTFNMGERGLGMTLAHRWAYEHLVGPFPLGLHSDHLCRNRSCVNPAHIEPVTPSENNLRGARAQKTHCANGHLRNAANTYTRPNGWRYCRVCCLRLKTAAYKRKRKLVAIKGMRP